MQENTNKAIAVNSIIMYLRMGINVILVLFTTRFALQALGVTDYGLFAVLGSIISFISIFNTIMLSTCNRFLAVAIGKGMIEEINKAFNVNLVLFLGCAVILLMLAYPVGEWYINNKMNYDGPIENARLVFIFSIVGATFSTLATPFNGLLMAKERFFLFSFVDVAMHILRFVVVWLMLYHFEHKLLIYVILNATTTALPALVYWIYCKTKFPEYIHWNFVRDKAYYKEVFGFSGWVAYGAVACVARQQGAVILVNLFFNTVMNAALGIANSLSTYVTMFANNLTQPMQPQITKSYAAGNTTRTDELLVMSTKFSFLLMLLIGSPFFVGADWILNLWLGEVPPYTAAFTVLLIVDNLVLSFNSGLSLMLFADGRIAFYQVVINTLRVLAIVAAYFVLKAGTAPQALFLTYIAFSLIIVFATQWCLHKTLNYDNSKLWKHSYLPSLMVLLLFIPVLFLPQSILPLVRILIATLYLLCIEFLVGLSKKEKLFILRGVLLIKKTVNHFVMSGIIRIFAK